MLYVGENEQRQKNEVIIQQIYLYTHVVFNLCNIDATICNFCNDK